MADYIAFPSGTYRVDVNLILLSTNDVVNTPRFILFDSVSESSEMASFALNTLTEGSGTIYVPPGATYYGRPNWFLGTPESAIRIEAGSTITVCSVCETE